MPNPLTPRPRDGATDPRDHDGLCECAACVASLDAIADALDTMRALRVALDDLA